MLNSETAWRLSSSHATVSKSWELGPIQIGAHLSEVGSCCPQLKQLATGNMKGGPRSELTSRPLGHLTWFTTQSGGKIWIQGLRVPGHSMDSGKNPFNLHKATAPVLSTQVKFH
ncbi:hypothetical protein SORBI_3007G102150 [Sorghum bicolor]|nr:hypothetical protein SORBI_3007G102150 [Sorghum bicolor]OQU80264.1 hypothetical protein SORBI_3007G102150 [Sorghum bicolor]